MYPTQPPPAEEDGLVDDAARCSYGISGMHIGQPGERSGKKFAHFAVHVDFLSLIQCLRVLRQSRLTCADLLETEAPTDEGFRPSGAGTAEIAFAVYT